MVTKRDRAEAIAAILEDLYPEVPVPLDHRDTYTLLIAVLLSAQCTDVRVNKTTPELFAKAATPQEMVKLKVSEIKAIIKPCGLSPQKSKAIHRLSEILIEKYDGEVPDKIELLEELPGVGHKTASVVVSQGFGQPAFPIDTHIHRLAYRWGLSTGANVKRTEQDLKRIYPVEKWNKLHLQIIFYGREYCKARSHNPYECPICSKYGRKAIFKEYDKSVKSKKSKKGS